MSDDDLGMSRPISRREFIDGVLIGAGAITATGWLAACTPESAGTTSTAAPTDGATAASYPPALTGMRGSTVDVASAMHALRDGAAWDASGAPTAVDEDYDLIVTTYGTLRRDAPAMKDVAFDYVILDEAQAIKNAATESASLTASRSPGRRTPGRTPGRRTPR